MDFGVAVLASFGSGHLDDFAGTTLEHDETVLAQGRALHREGGGGSGVPGLEVCILDVCHCVVCRVLDTVRSDLVKDRGNVRTNQTFFVIAIEQMFCLMVSDYCNTGGDTSAFPAF